MSRSRKGSKGCGYDYWGKRVLSAICGYGRSVKKITNKIERRRAKQSVRRGEDLPMRAAI